MTRRKVILAGVALVGLFVIAGSIEHADAAPIMQHSGGSVWLDSNCLPNGAWQATLNITATNPELNPVAHITDPATDYDVAVPFVKVYTLPGTQADETVKVVITWSDGFTVLTGTHTIERPAGGCASVATSVVPTTGAVTSPSTTPTTATPVPGSSTATTPTSTISSTPPFIRGYLTPQLAPPISIVQTTTPKAALPETGGSPVEPVLIAAGLIVVGALLASTRRWAS